MSYAHPHPGPPPDLPELPEGAPPPQAPPRRRGLVRGPGGRGPVTPWPPWTALVGFLAAFGVAVVGGLIIALAGAALFGGDVEDPPPGALIAATVFQDVALVGAAIVIARVTTARGAWHFGLRPVRVAPAAGWLAATYVGLLGITAAWLTLMRALGVDVHDSNDLPAGLGTEDSTLALAVVGVLVTVVAPIAEEVFFRGFFFTALRNWKGVPAAALITGIVFGALHIGSAPAVFLVPLGAFGALLCLLYWRTGSLLPCIAVHAINNSVAYGASQHWTWQIAPVMVGALATCGLLLAPVVARAREPSSLAAGVASQ